MLVSTLLKKINTIYDAEFLLNDGFFGEISFPNNQVLKFPNIYLEGEECEDEILGNKNYCILWEWNISYEQSLFCVTCPLNQLQRNIEGNLENLKYAKVGDSIDYLLVNPREDVVNWALENKELLSFDVSGWDNFEQFIKEKQANPILQNKILHELKGSYNDK